MYVFRAAWAAFLRSADMRLRSLVDVSLKAVLDARGTALNPLRLWQIPEWAADRLRRCAQAAAARLVRAVSMASQAASKASIVEV